MGDDKFLLTLEIAGRKYPLKINIKINQYRVALGGEKSNLTTQDFVAMTAIQALAENFTLGDKNNTKPFEDKIDLLISEIDNYLKN